MIKKFFDFFVSIFAIIFLFGIIFISFLLACLDTKSFGIFSQLRIGQYGKPFLIYKIKTVHDTTKKISVFGNFLRNSKLDELPQLFNILNGTMSFVGPRPDVAGYYDLLKGEERKILELKPGLTSAASIKYSKEEELLKEKKNPLDYNDTVIFPDKVKMNLAYYYKNSLWLDIRIIFKTIF
jgi:lipopolysaccharide/colanic/teichoic acid biosynthesis glycosyltransferase